MADELAEPLLDSERDIQGNRLAEDIYLNIHPKRRYWRNLICLCLSFTFVFTSYSSLQNLQSTLNDSKGLGVASLSCIYGGMVFACFYAPVLVRKIGPKWSILCGFLAQTLFAGANFYPQFYTLVPASVILGLASAPLWTGQGVFLTQLAMDYSVVLQEQAAIIISRFNGVFFLFFQSPQLIGNAISSILLDQGANASQPSPNSTECGINFCTFDDTNSTNTNDKPNSKTVVYILLAVYTGCCVVGFLITLLGVDNRPVQTRVDGEQRSWKESVMATVHIHANKWILLLLPMFLYNGMEQAFLFSEYTQAFISCELGIGQVGYCMMGFGAANSLSSFVMGRLEKFTGRVLLFLSAASINMALLIFMIFWDPADGPVELIYAIPALWGIGDSIWQTTTCAFVGVEFSENQEPAFATFRLWQSLGFVLCFGYSTFLCMDIKTYITLGLLAVSVVMYIICEVGLRKQKKQVWMDIEA